LGLFQSEAAFLSTRCSFNGVKTAVYANRAALHKPEIKTARKIGAEKKVAGRQSNQFGA